MMFCQWTNLDTGINDDLTGVVFFQNNGMVSGQKGLYYTSNGGVGLGSWTRFKITDNADNSNLYENTRFNFCYSKPGNFTDNGYVFACGQNMLNNKAVIIRIHIPTLAYQIMYVGKDNSSLNKIVYSTNGSNKYYAVGDHGLIIRFSETQISDAQNIGTENFSSISFYGNGCKITLDGKILYSSYIPYYEFTNYNFTEILTPNSNNKASTYSSNYFFTAGNNFSYAYNSDAPSFHTNYDFGTLNANSIITANDNLINILVGTDHGIFRMAGLNTLEWQPSSLNYNVKGFWGSASNGIIYACGNDGVILKAPSFYSPMKPYVKLNLEGGCIGSYIYMNKISGSSNNCTWFINNVKLTNQSCDSFTQLFSTAGDYEIKLVGNNGSIFESTDIKTIKIVPRPVINKVVTLSDNILCKGEKIQVQIQNSQPNVTYTLKNSANTLSYGTSGIGDGSTILFTSSLIEDTGSYYIEAKNILGPCNLAFTDKINIIVEKTKADFHCDLINAETNEEVNFYEKSDGAQNYQWIFPSNSSISTSATTSQLTSFSSQGMTSVNLEVWSNNDCHDQIEKSGPFIYNTPTNSDECWTIVNNGTDIQSSNYGRNAALYKLTPTKDGFLTCGIFNNETFASKTGVTYNLKNKTGSYLAKYNKNGTLKWVVYTLKDQPTSNSDAIFSSVVDNDGNIYICGSSNGYLYDNKGDKISLFSSLYPSSTENGYIIKLDSNGRFIWKLTNNTVGYVSTKLYVDKDNNLVSVCTLSESVNTSGESISTQLYFNGIPSSKLNLKKLSSSGSNCAIVKISTTGSVIWYTGVNIRYTNAGGISDLGFDLNNNIYITGGYEHFVDFYSVGNTSAQVLNGNGKYGNTMFLAKFNSEGLLQWKLKSNVFDGNFNGTYGESMVVDDEGNCFVIGSNICKTSSLSQVFENTDGTTTQESVGAGFFSKINSNGICEWIEGIKYTSYGWFTKLIKEGNNFHILGTLRNINSGILPVSAEFTSADSKNYYLTIGAADSYIITYNSSGDLIKVMVSGENETYPTNVISFGFNDFFKDKNSFYLSGGISVSSSSFNIFGNLILPTNGNDSTITRINESCGIIKYESSLVLNKFSEKTEIQVYPNPTKGNFSIDLKDTKSDVEVEIVTLLGKNISSQKFKNVNQINATINGVEGLYFINVKLKDSSTWFKVMKN